MPSASGRTQPRAPGKAGFTLVELLVTAAVAGLLLAFVYQIFIAQQRSQLIQEEVADAQQNARVALGELTRSLASAGAGVVADGGQVRLLVARPDAIAFNADRSDDHDALAAGSAPVPGASGSDPHLTIPGTYAASPAETYHYFLRPDGPHQTLVQVVNRGDAQQVALHLANGRLGEPLFRYYGDFDGDGSFETLDRVDTVTSPRVHAGEPLDMVIRRVELNVVTQTATPDPRQPAPGYRLTRLASSVSPRNLWDCPVIGVDPATVPDADPAIPGVQVRRAPGASTSVSFRVARGGVAEAGRRVDFALNGPSAATVNAGAVTDANGRVIATIAWPSGCGSFPIGQHTLAARTAEPPTLSTPFGLCAPHATELDLDLIPGLPSAVSFDGVAVSPGAPASADAAHTLQAPSCGGGVEVTYRVLDYCAGDVRPQDVGTVGLGIYDDRLQPVPGFGDLAPAILTTPSGTLRYTTRDQGLYSAFPTVQRSNLVPNPYETVIRPTGMPGQVNVEIHPTPNHLVNLTANIPRASFWDCPDPALGVADTFGIEDACGNPLTTLVANPFGPFDVTAHLRATATPAPTMGSLVSPGNPSPLPDTVVLRQDDGTGQVSSGTPGALVPGGSFEIRYVPPTCGLGARAYRPEITLTPSWSPAAAPAPIAVDLSPCTTCSVRVLDAGGSPVTSLNRECAADYWVEVSHCEPGGTSVELVIASLSGGGNPSFSPTGLQTRLLLSFPPSTPPGGAQTARARLYVYGARSGSHFQLSAHLPRLAAAGTLPYVTCQSGPIGVDTSCDEILISAVPDNPGPTPANPSAADTPLCAADGSEVFFRVRDCDQNLRDTAGDDIQNTAGTSGGLLVEVVGPDGAVLDREGPDLFETDVHGTPATDSPYFQGSLAVTQDPGDGAFSGRLRAPLDRVVLLRARYVDPDDPGDDRCAAQALLVPPIPVCLGSPVQSWGDWGGNLRVHGGDAVVAGDLLLPAPPLLVAKAPIAPPPGASFGMPAVDPFFNAYVGGSISAGGSAPAPVGRALVQPFVPGGPLAAVSNAHPNYFQAVPDAAGLMGRLDYDRLKALAQAFGVYWEAVPAATGWAVANPSRPQLGPLSFEDATRLNGPGLHDGSFLFVDAPPSLQGAGLVDQAPLADLPSFTVSGSYYTEGLLYVAGSVTLAPASGQRSVPIETASGADSRYDEGTATVARSDLPIDFAPSTGPSGAGSVSVHLRGALYCDGEIRMPGAPRIYGALAAERGVPEAGRGEIWYDPRWTQSRIELCSLCCGLSLSPVAPEVALGDALGLTADRPKGRVTWTSLAPQVATVDPSGLVTSVALGTAVIRAVDESGCVAEAEVRVFCGLSLSAPGGTELEPGEQATVVGTGQRGAPAWDIDAPASLRIVQNFGPSVLVEAGAVGGARVTATDPLGCPAALDFVVNCPRGRVLSAQPLAPTPGDTVTLRVTDGGADVSSRYRFAAAGVPLAGSSFLVPGLAPVSFTAALPGSQCPLGPLSVTPACPDLSLTASPEAARIGEAVRLAVRDAAEADLTPSFTFSAAPAGAAAISGAVLTPSAAGTLSVSGVDARGCTAGPRPVTVSP